MTETILCPICSGTGVREIHIDQEMPMVETTGLFFAPGQGRVRGRRSVIVKHGDGRKCRGEPPTEWKLP